MPRSDYCRRQAELLLSMALATSDPERAERLRIRAEALLAEATLPDDTDETFTAAVDGYNDDQMRGT